MFEEGDNAKAEIIERVARDVLYKCSKWNLLSESTRHYARKTAEKCLNEAHYFDLLDAALELLYLKDHLKQANPAEYERRKPLAWQALRDVLGRIAGEE